MTKFISSTNPIERRIITGLLLFCVFGVVAYAYLVAATVFHVTARKNAEYQIQLVRATVAGLETAYLDRSLIIQDEGVDGLTAVEEKRYVYLASERTLTLYDEN